MHNLVGSAPSRVPLIREELRLIPAANNPDGSPAWMIYDSICNKFYRINWLDFEILIRWPTSLIEDIVNKVNHETTLNVSADDVAELTAFLLQHNLLIANTPEATSQLIEKSKASKKSILSWLLHHYLFFRIPLVRPQKALAALLPYIKWIFSTETAMAVIFATLLGLFLTAREWDTFQNTFIDQLTFSGLFSYGVALLFSKFLHEFGHAITATRYGVRVGHMGIAMLVLFPMPYTDTSESWKLTDPQQRLHIASAGIITELAIAGLSSLAWALAPVGNLKEALFFLATTSWILTLIINVSPFLRFDGYFILSDLMDFPNLHARAGALAKTAMRKVLLGFEDEYPEVFPKKKRNGLIIFAYATWIYRLIVFLGIALLVYYFFFKALGIILFVLEILWFILLPIWREVKDWIARREEIKKDRILFGATFLVVLIALGLIPWQSNVKGTGWIHADQQTSIFTPTAGKLVDYHAKGPVKKGEVLFHLTSPDIAIQALRSQSLSKAREKELLSLSGLKDGETKRALIQSQQEKFNAEVKLYKDELSRMSLIAPFSGELLDINENLVIGTWVNSDQKLAMLIDPKSWVTDVLIEEADIRYIQPGDLATIYLLKSRLQKLQGTVTEIDNAARVTKLPHMILDAQHGGPIATLPGDDLVPKEGLMKVRISFNQQPDLTSMAVGNVEIKTQPRAWLPTVFKRIAAIFIRESGF